MQAAHAALELPLHHPDAHRGWSHAGGYLILLSVPDESALDSLHRDLVDLDALVVGFREPDVGDQLTALSCLPSAPAARLLRRLPLFWPSPIPTSEKKEVRT